MFVGRTSGCLRGSNHRQLDSREQVGARQPMLRLLSEGVTHHLPTLIEDKRKAAGASRRICYLGCATTLFRHSACTNDLPLPQTIIPRLFVTGDAQGGVNRSGSQRAPEPQPTGGSSRAPSALGPAVSCNCIFVSTRLRAVVIRSSFPRVPGPEIVMREWSFLAMAPCRWLASWWAFLRAVSPQPHRARAIAL